MMTSAFAFARHIQDAPRDARRRLQRQLDVALGMRLPKVFDDRANLAADPVGSFPRPPAKPTKAMTLPSPGCTICPARCSISLAVSGRPIGTTTVAGVIVRFVQLLLMDARPGCVAHALCGVCVWLRAILALFKRNRNQFGASMQCLPLTRLALWIRIYKCKREAETLAAEV